MNHPNLKRWPIFLHPRKDLTDKQRQVANNVDKVRESSKYIGALTYSLTDPAIEDRAAAYYDERQPFALINEGDRLSATRIYCLRLPPACCWDYEQRSN